MTTVLITGPTLLAGAVADQMAPCGRGYGFGGIADGETTDGTLVELRGGVSSATQAVSGALGSEERRDHALCAG